MAANMTDYLLNDDMDFMFSQTDLGHALDKFISTYTKLKVL
jgi:hypothetical protein